VREHYPGITIVEVASVIGLFDAVRNGEADAGLDTAAILDYTMRQFFIGGIQLHQPLQLGQSPLPEQLHFLVHNRLAGVADIFNLALANISEEQQQVLRSKWLEAPRQLQQGMGTLPYLELKKLTVDAVNLDRLNRVAINGRDHFVYIQTLGGQGASPDYFAVVTPVASVLQPATEKVTRAIWITGACLLLLLPLSSWLAGFIVKPITRLADENRKISERNYGALTPVNSRIVEIENLATSLATMAKAIEQHAREQEALMEAFLTLIAQAIDDKSPYTAKHCARVPELAMMLARQAHQSQEKPFDGFSFDNDQQWREFRVGAWLHDCGKITTPEHIIDKGTKLEANYNRIHEIRTRFEVLWRDAEIDYWRQRLAGERDEHELSADLDRRRQQLQEDFAFIADCNLGGENLDDSAVARLEQLSAIRWQRHFDDRLGLSPIEKGRLSGVAQSVPATERLLADKPEHIIPRVDDKEYPQHFCIRMDIPEHLYNLGELYNLKIARGTLTTEDRFKINEHIISTIKMLDSLPFPEELARVPRYATTHHETLDGTGYPRKLTAEDLSIPERIMVLADIFEALTAGDRPYKPAKPMSVAIDILHSMVQSNHVDAHVFELFLRSGAYLEFAQRFLPPEQIDEVDIDQYLS
jgi:HD-GYP domain-containing protein (c-di-GMP phosphodiesterase class II)